ncbi:MAG: glycosyl transferase, partial [Pseudomonadota bacterium]
LWWQSGQSLGQATVLLILMGLLFGFLVVNLSRNKIFLGDSGSIPLGFVLGAILLQLAQSVGLVACFILIAYYLVDPLSTLAIRMHRKENLLQAHRDHAYQFPVQHGRSHIFVSGFLALVHGVLIALALSAQHAPFLSLTLAVIVAIWAVIALRCNFAWRAGRTGS